MLPRLPTVFWRAALNILGSEIQGMALVRSSSLALLIAIAAITLLGHAGSEGGGVRRQRAGGTTSSD